MEEDTTEGTETPVIVVESPVEGEKDKVGEVDIADHPETFREGANVDKPQEKYVESEQVNKKKVVLSGGDELLLLGEELEGEQIEGEQEIAKQEGKLPEDEIVEEEEKIVEEPPPDPTAPFDFTDSKEALKEPFELRPDQIAEVEQLWAIYQDYTPAYTDLDNYITEKELVYMLKALLLMTHTPEQLLELIAFCVRPPHPEGHITYDQFLKMVRIRQRDLPIEEEIRIALKVYDTINDGTIDREYFKKVLATHGHKMSAKHLDSLVKEVDMSNDGTIGIEDVVGTMAIDLNQEDMQMLRDAIKQNAPNITENEEQEVAQLEA